MSANLNEIEQKAMGLSVKQRAILAEHLLASLDEVNFTENEKMWTEEADRRYREYKEGRISARLFEDALHNAKERLQ